MATLLASVLAAMRPGALPHDLDDVGIEPDAQASIPPPPHVEAPQTGGSMSVTQTVAGGALQAHAGNLAAAAPISGGDGTPAALAAVTAVMSAAEINGDAGRMSAAIALMALAPALSAEDVTAYVTRHVPAAGAAGSTASVASAPTAATPAPQTYADRRVAAAQFAMPSVPAASASSDGLNPSKVFAARRAAVKGA